MDKKVTLLKAMHEAACRAAVTMMEKNNSMVSCILVPDKGSLTAIPAPWQSPEEKPGYIAGMRELIHERMIPAYCFVTEAWIAPVDPRTQPELMNVPARERSDREDVLIILSRHRNGENYATKYHVEYDATGKVTLGPAEHLDGDFSAGLMGNLFEREAA